MSNILSPHHDAEKPVKVSVIVPVYGVEKYIKQCIDSILGQSFKAFELICIDDASKDNSAAIVAAAAERDPRIRLIRNQSNLGVGASRNIGLKEAKGEFIKVMDSDDYLMPEALELLVRKAEEEQLDIVFHDAFILHPNERLTTYPCPDGDASLDRICGHAAWWYLFKRSIIEQQPQIRFPEGAHPHEDTAFSFMLISFCVRHEHIPRELIYYRQHEEMITQRVRGALSAASAHSAIVCTEKLAEFFKTLEKPIRARRRQVFDALMNYFYSESEGHMTARLMSYHIKRKLLQLIYRSKVTNSGSRVVKILKVPVYYKRQG